MSNLPKIAESEWLVMQVIWKHKSATAQKVIEALTPTTNWKPKTVKTLLNRLVKKKALGFNLDPKDQRTYHYYPLVEETACVRAENQSFLERIYGGSANVMLARFLEQQDFSVSEIEELKQILEQKKSGRR